MSRPAATRFEVFGLPGMPEVRPGDDLVQVLAPALGSTPLADGDIVVVTSKIVSKAEGRVLKGVDRDEAVDAETVRTISEWTTVRGRTRIAETRHGFVMAAAGVDASNVEHGSVVLLPLDPDASARALRAGLRDRYGVHVGVVITDTAGRAWRDGVVDFAVGAAGLRAVDDLRGRSDRYGNDLGVTVVAVADELAAASELVRTKLSGVPVAVVRGLAHLLLGPGDDDPGAAALVRPTAEDRFRLGTPEAMREAVHARRSARQFAPKPVDPAVVQQAVSAALTAPWSAETRRSPEAGEVPPWRFVLVESATGRQLLADSVDREGEGDGRDDLGVLRTAPYVVVPCVLDHSPDAVLALGAAVENLLVALGAEGLASAWLFPSAALSAAASSLDLPAAWAPMGAIAVGHGAAPVAGHSSFDVADFTVTR